MFKNNYHFSFKNRKAKNEIKSGYYWNPNSIKKELELLNL